MTTAEPSRTENATNVETSVTCGFPTKPIVGLEAVPSGDTPGEDRTDQARAHEAAAEVLADRGDWRRAYHHLKAAVSLVRDERALPSGVPDQLRVEVDRLRRERAEAREQSRRDSLTATWNRRYLDERLGTLRDGSHGGAACVALADVDHFKDVNDTHGHALGDEVLRRLVDLMSEGLPEDGFCARYGGEEFALVLPGVEPAEAVRVCEEARARVDAHPWHEIAEGLRVTVSVGVACLDACDGGTPQSPGLDAADALLYVAKRAGRNAVAFRDTADGEVRLAGAAGGRRGIGAAVRRAFPSA
ncbi:GGDEF domain-containing protein [Actinomycetospora flava]|uniref:GGDEF domain-containing protein n=1 Tax=Actinomycetospora flava TaxID=3129232 RepID=A0ABU8M6D5_9PSEU